MKALKALVIGMGVLIVIGIALVGYGLTRSKPQPGATVAGSHVQAPVSEAKSGYFTSELPVPKGAHLEQLTASGDRLVLRFSSPDGERLVLLDSHTGQLAGTIALVPDNR
jgi:hypothetical protein